MLRRPPRSPLSSSSAASDVYKRQVYGDELHIETLAAHRITLRGRVLRTEFDGDGGH